jgi:HEAT repeat protein
VPGAESAKPQLSPHHWGFAASAPGTRQQTARLIADLDSSRYAVRQQAAEALARLDESAVPALRAALAGRPSAEVRRRIGQLLAKAQGPFPRPETLGALRAVTVLEQVGTPEARELLRVLARGMSEARLTQEAQAALRRLARGAAATP